MDRPLRVLNVEDSERDVSLLRRHLTSSGYVLTTDRVDTASSMAKALKAKEWDIILCDYSMPQFNALSALTVLKDSGLDIPLIIISGTVGEDVAVEAMRTGAQDYLMKDNLVRLEPTIERELHEAENRRTKRQSETERKIIFEIIQGAIASPNLDEFLKLVHRSISQIVYAENCFVMLRDPVTEMEHFEFWVDKYDPPPIPRLAGKSFSSYILRTGKPLLLTEEIKTRMFADDEAEQVGSTSPSWLGIPLRTQNITIGVLVLQHYEESDAYSERDLEFLSSVGDQIALAIERKRTAQAVAESEERYRELVENALDIIYTHDLSGNYTSVNKAAETITGYPKEEAMAMNIADTVAPDQLEIARKMIAAKLAGNEVTAYDLDLIAKDGHRVPVEVNTRIIYENGVPVGVQGIARDITERKRAENERRVIFEIIQGAITSRDLDEYLKLVHGSISQIVYAENFRVKLYDPVTEFIHNKYWVDKFEPCTPPHPVVKGFGAYILRTGQPLLLTKDLKNKMVEMGEAILSGTPSKSWLGIPLRTPTRTIGLMILQHYEIENAFDQRDLEFLSSVGDQIALAIERQSAGDALSESEDRYRTIFETSPDALAKFDLTMNVLMANERSAQVFGFANSKDMLGINAFDLIAPEYHERARSNMAVMFETGQMVPVESLGVKADGSHFAVEFGATLIRNGDGSPEAILGVTRDITERKKADAAMRDSEERFSGAFEFAPIGVALVSPDGHWLKVNLALCELVGYTEDELLGTTFQDITFEEDLDHDLAKMHNLIADEITSYQIEKRYVHKLGHLVPVLLNVSLVRDDQGKPRYFISQIQDMTDRKQLEEQFRQSQKMEAIGVLAGGIAHDFNNLLTAINGYSDLTLRKMKTDDPLRHNVEEVKKAGERAAELTSQLLAFSRKQVLKPMVHGLNSVIENIERMLRRIIRENVELRTVLDPTLGNIKADPGQVEQVIMNLAVNARDAMPKGGTLTIETQNVYLDDDYVSQNLTIAPGPFVRLTVTDTGEGMDENTKQHIFEPFFTTKEVGKGTGLGLSMVYGVLKQSGGDIMVYSELEHGTTFKIYLPRVDENVDRPKWTGDREQKYLGDETILLVEDEEVVRNLVREILTDNGYNVLETASGREALKVCSSYDKPIHLLLSDVIMPKMSGSELKDEVVKILPDIRILFMSGYTDDSIANRGVFDADIAFIEKPFTPDALSRKVREVLEY